MSKSGVPERSCAQRIRFRSRIQSAHDRATEASQPLSISADIPLHHSFEQQVPSCIPSIHPIMFETSRLAFREYNPCSETDRSNVFALFSNTQVTSTSMAPGFSTPKSADWLDRTFHDWVYDPTTLVSLLVSTKPCAANCGSKSQKSFIGFTMIFSASLHHRSAKFLIMLLPEFWSNGYGTEICNLMLQVSFTWLGLRKVTLGVFEANRNAVRLYEKV